MPITRNNLEIRRPERDDGGRMGTLVVVDNQSNNIFPDTGRIALAAGRVWLQGAYAFVNQAGLDTLTGAYMCITRGSNNPNVSYAIFSTGSSFDYEADYKKYLTSYLTAGGRLQCHLLERQLKDTSAVQVWMRESAPFPEIGKTYILIGDEGLSSQYEQAILVEAVEYAPPNGLRTYFEPGGQVEYQRKVATLKFKGGLRNTFYGPSVSRYEPVNPSAAIHETLVSEGAARLYGIARLTSPVEAGEYVLEVDAVSIPVVPASIRETIHANDSAAVVSDKLIAAADGYYEFHTSFDFGPGVNLYLGGPAVPGTLAGTVSGGAATLRAVGAQLLSGSTVVATIDSAAGIVTPVPNCPLYVGTKTWRFMPAGRSSAPSQSLAIKVTVANRGKAWLVHLPLPPAPMSVEVDYYAGDWFRLSEIGDGLLGGSNPKAGSAQITSDGDLIITLGLFPDPDTWIIIRFGTSAITKSRAGSLPKAYFEFDLANAPSPGTLTLAWNDGIGNRTASADMQGILGGDGTGWVRGKKVRLYPNTVPPKGAQVTAIATPRAQMSESIPLLTLIGGSAPVTLTLAQIPIPGTVEMGFTEIKAVNPPAYSPDAPLFSYAGIG